VVARKMVVGNNTLSGRGLLMVSGASVLASLTLCFLQ